jgi:predicted DNA-binding ribbon-helix-helix protein
MSGRIKNRKVVIAGRRCSISLEEEIWDALLQIASQRGVVFEDLIRTAASEIKDIDNVRSKLRLYVFRHFLARIEASEGPPRQAKAHSERAAKKRKPAPPPHTPVSQMAIECLTCPECKRQSGLFLATGHVSSELLPNPFQAACPRCKARFLSSKSSIELIKAD